MLWILMSGWAVAFGGTYEKCDISNGQVFSCTSGLYNGVAVVKTPSGTYEQCDISNGQVFSCTSGWYNGTAVVWKE